ncbi:MAG: cyclic lactone autoinducer peptide [Lachnospiraceae bacterium]|nr:cyclic lactone autoinducer peptide [Lachnospiraceae bacterium]
MALMVATVAANSRCAYIFHDPAKPDSLKRLRKF